MKYAKIDAHKDADLAPEFSTSARAMPVVIFSHGIRGHRNVASGICRELASQGFAVYSLEHNDGTSACKLNEKDLKMDTYEEEDMQDLGLWAPRLDKRVTEVQKLLDYLHSGKKSIQNFPEIQNASEFLDLERVILMGHGFGGCTALATSLAETDRVSHLVMLDPWLFALHKEILDNELKVTQPMVCINSEEYHPNVKGFDSWETVATLFYSSAGVEDLSVMIKGTGHLFMTDVLSLAPLEFKMWTGRNPSNEVCEMYELGNKVIMKWLQDYGFPEVQISEHSQISPFYEKQNIEVVNKPEGSDEEEGEEDEDEG